MKKFIACILTVIMILSFTTMAFAAGNTDIKNSRYEEAISALTEMEIVNGYPNGKFYPNETLTRAEAATIMVRSLYGESVVRDIITFTDVNVRDWFYEYVNTAVYYDIVHGMGHNQFAPNEEVTVDQMVTMVLNALGYNAPQLAGSWPENVQKIAKRLGLYYNLPKTLEGSDAITRGQACQMIYNALDCYCVEYYRGRIIETEKTLYEMMGFKYETKDGAKADAPVVGPTDPTFKPTVEDGQIWGQVRFIKTYTYGSENEYTGFEIVFYDSDKVYKTGGTKINGVEYYVDGNILIADGDELWLSETYNGSGVYRIDKIVTLTDHNPDLTPVPQPEEPTDPGFNGTVDDDEEIDDGFLI